MLRNTWNKEETHRGALLCQKPSDTRSCSRCWWPKPAQLPLCGTRQVTCPPGSFSMLLPPRGFFPLLEEHLCCSLAPWFLIPLKAGTGRRLIPSSMNGLMSHPWTSLSNPGSSNLPSGGPILRKTQPSCTGKRVQTGKQHPCLTPRAHPAHPRGRRAMREQPRRLIQEMCSE